MRVPFTRNPTGTESAAGTWTSIEHRTASTVMTAVRRTTLFILDSAFAGQLWFGIASKRTVAGSIFRSGNEVVLLAMSDPQGGRLNRLSQQFEAFLAGFVNLISSG